MNQGEIIIYQTPDGETELNVNVGSDTVWLTQAQMAELFQRDRTVITRHINNIFKEGELDSDKTCAYFAHIGENALRGRYETILYNLDVIISVGYRVKSARGTQFRIWANRVLKEYLLKGYAINQNAKAEQLEELKGAVRLLSNVLETQSLSADEATGLLKVITDFTYALDTLDRYDYQQLEISDTTAGAGFHATYESATAAIAELREKFGSGGLFGRRLVPFVDRHDLSNFRWRGAIPKHRGEGGDAALPGRQKPLVQRRQQAHRGVPVPMVFVGQRHPLQTRRHAPDRQQHPRRPNSNDRRVLPR